MRPSLHWQEWMSASTPWAADAGQEHQDLAISIPVACWGGQPATVMNPLALAESAAEVGIRQMGRRLPAGTSPMGFFRES